MSRMNEILPTVVTSVLLLGMMALLPFSEIHQFIHQSDIHPSIHQAIHHHFHHHFMPMG